MDQPRPPEKPRPPEEPPSLVGAFVGGAVLTVAGVAMAVNLISGQAEFVHGPRTGHWLVALLGESCFSVLACVVCLLLGATFLVGGALTARDRLAAAAADPRRPLGVSCPECGRSSQVPRKAAGRRLRCPDCGTEFRAPGG
ncbi:MAG: hypothetical protein KF878_33910 [Planctomycetes bacterium]|nr:hypothetical protein [Planctomycetota bacterium]